MLPLPRHALASLGLNVEFVDEYALSSIGVEVVYFKRILREKGSCNSSYLGSWPRLVSVVRLLGVLITWVVAATALGA